MYDGRLALVDFGPPPLRMEAVGLDLAVARPDCAHERHDPGVGVIKRQGIVYALFPGTEGRQTAERGVPGARCHLVAVRQNAALRSPRGAGSIENAGGGFRLGWARARRACCRRQRPCRECLFRQYWRAMVAARNGIAQLHLACSEGEHEVWFAVLEEISHFIGAVVRSDRYATHTDRIQRQLVQNMLGTIFEQDGDTVSKTIAGASVGADEIPDKPVCFTIGDLEAVRQIVALIVCRYGKKRPLAMGRNG